jgi:acetoin utilization deacetylase AcuC-like enzyme
MNKTARTTAYFTHPDSLRHEMGRGHPECPERIKAIEAKMESSGLNAFVERRTAPEASLEQLALAHTASHVADTHEAAMDLVEQFENQGEGGGLRYLPLDPDTTLNPYSWGATTGAAGAVIAATDAVMKGEVDNAFCAVRPPGHHATRGRSMGFCFFNQVAIGVKYAMEEYGLTRVAVVDFDVHHGNGTEDILSGDDRVLMCGIFQHPFYPHSGTGNVAANMLNLPIPARTSGAAICEQIKEGWLPELDAFKPQIIFISAGFDAHKDDDLGQLGMTEADYVWISKELMKIADMHCNGRIVSSLEGGYNLNALANSVAAHVQALTGLV